MKLFRAVLSLAALLAASANAATIRMVAANSTDVTVTVRIVDSTDGTPETGVVYNTSGIDLEYWRYGANSVTDITEATQTVSGAHSDGGFVHLGNGYYRLDLPDAAVASGASAVEIMGTVTGMVVIGGTVELSPAVSVASGGIVAASFGSGAIDATAIAADAIGASELATDAIGAAEIATDAIGANEIAASAIGASEIADGGITSAEFGTGAITATVVAADAIGASEVAADVSTELLTGLANLAVNVAQVSGDSTAADTLETWLDGTAGSAIPLGIVDQGTAQSATGTTLVLRSALAMGDDTAIGMTLIACGSTQGYCQSRAVTDYVSSTDTATVDTWTVTPSGTVTYYLIATAPGGGGSLSASDVWAYATRTLTALDEDSTTIDLNASYVGGVTVFDEDSTTIDIDGTTLGTVSTATAVTTVNGLASNVITAAAIANDAIGATEVADGAIDAATLASDTITAAKIAADAIGASELAADAVGAAEIANSAIDAATFAAGAIDASAIAADAIAASELAATAVDEFWDEPQSGHVTAGTFGVYLDSAVSGVSTGGVSAGDIADAVWDEALSGHSTGGSAGAALTTASGAAGLDAAGVRAAIGLASANLDTQLGAIDDYVDTEVATAVSQTAASAIRTAIGLSTANLDTQLSGIESGISWSSSWDAEVQSEVDDALNAYDPPTNAELATALGTADDATLAAIAALNNLSAAQVRDLTIEDQGGGVTLGCAIAIVMAYAAGDLATSGSDSVYEDPSGTETRIAGTVVSAGNRTATITCPTY